MDNRKFNECIVELMGTRMQQMVLDFLWENYRFNKASIDRFDGILKKYGVRRSEEYGVGWEKSPDFVEMEIDDELYIRLKQKYQSYDKIGMSFDEWVNYIIQVGLDNDD